MTSHQHRTIRNPARRLRVLRAAGNLLGETYMHPDWQDDAHRFAREVVVADVTNRLARRGIAATHSMIEEYAEALDAYHGLTSGRDDVEQYLGGERYYVPREMLAEALADDYYQAARRLERHMAGVTGRV